MLRWEVVTWLYLLPLLLLLAFDRTTMRRRRRVREEKEEEEEEEEEETETEENEETEDALQSVDVRIQRDDDGAKGCSRRERHKRVLRVSRL